MITKIKKIKNLGIFNSYVVNASLPDFKRYNVIYGWNGTGKTTLSKLFDALPEGKHDDYTLCEYEIQNKDGSVVQQGQPFTKGIRIFNQDYIEKNLQIRAGRTKAITLVLGTVTQEMLDQLAKDEAELDTKRKQIAKEKKSVEAKEKTKGKSFTDIAKTIYVGIAGGAIRAYRKDSAEAEFKKLTGKFLISDEKIAELLTTIKQNQKPVIDEVAFAEIKKDNAVVSLSDVVANLSDTSKLILDTSVDAIVIDRLRDNPSIAEWIETGLHIHQEYDSKDCEFCGQTIPLGRLEDLAKHFSVADKELKNNIDTLIADIGLIKTCIPMPIEIPDVARLYDELADGYEKAKERYITYRELFLQDLTKAESELKEKKSKTTEKLPFETIFRIEEVFQAIAEINSFIGKHNTKSTEFEKTKAEAVTSIKNHYLSTIYDEVKGLENEIKKYEESINKLTHGDPENIEDRGVIQLQESIIQLRSTISSTHKACEDINDGLATFLGRKELVFAPHKIKIIGEDGSESEFEDGYIIERNGQVVKNLSEGERTAIAFVYFTIHLKETSFDKANGIVVVDDPISSLDSNSMFQAFSFLKIAVKDAQQVFILTHNFDFPRLVLNWLGHSRIKNTSSFYMIKNKYVNTDREAYLDKLDEDLEKQYTEYNYLFKKLYDFQGGDGTIASVYHMPNISRKVLESFLTFRVPNNKSTFEKLESLKDVFDEHKMSAIYKFTNDQSHITGKGFDPSLVPETQKVVKELMELIETTFPEHYKVLTTQ